MVERLSLTTESAGTKELIPKLCLSTQYQEILTQLQPPLKLTILTNLNFSLEIPLARAATSQMKFNPSSKGPDSLVNLAQIP